MDHSRPITSSTLVLDSGQEEKQRKDLGDKKRRRGKNVVKEVRGDMLKSACRY